MIPKISDSKRDGRAADDRAREYARAVRWSAARPAASREDRRARGFDRLLGFRS